MNKKTMRKILSLALTLILLSILFVTAFAEGNYIVDIAGVLSDSERNKLEDLAQEVNEKYGIETAVLIVDSFNNEDPALYTDSYWNSSGYGEDCSIFAIAVNDREYYLYNCGTASDAVTDYGSYYVDDQILPYLKNSDWYGAAKEYIKTNESLYKMYSSTGNAYDIDSKPTSAGTIIFQLIICLALGFGLSVLVLNSKRKAMKTVVSDNKADIYTNSKNFKLTEEKDQFYDKKVVVIPLPHDNNHRGPGNGMHTGGTTMHTGTNGHSFSGHRGSF